MSCVFPGDLLVIQQTTELTNEVDPISFTEVKTDSYVCRSLGSFKISKEEENHKVSFSINKAGSFYIPRPNDFVIGFITRDRTDKYSVDIGMSAPGLLSNTAYEGATKQTPLVLEIGDIVYCRVLPRSVNPLVLGGASQVQLSCMDQQGSSAKLGKLTGGYVLDTTVAKANALMNISHPILQELSKEITFEICSGSNGKIWFNSADDTNMTVMWNALKGPAVSGARVKQVLAKFKKN